MASMSESQSTSSVRDSIVRLLITPLICTNGSNKSLDSSPILNFGSFPVEVLLQLLFVLVLVTGTSTVLPLSCCGFWFRSSTTIFASTTLSETISDISVSCPIWLICSKVLNTKSSRRPLGRISSRVVRGLVPFLLLLRYDYSAWNLKQSLIRPPTLASHLSRHIYFNIRVGPLF